MNAKSADRSASRPRAPSACDLPRRPVVKPRYDGRSAGRAAKIDWMLVTELQSRGSFGVCTKLADLVTWHSSAAHGGGSCTMRSTKAASYTSIVTVRASSEAVGALHRRMSQVAHNIRESTLPPVGPVPAELNAAHIGMKGSTTHSIILT